MSRLVAEADSYVNNPGRKLDTFTYKYSRGRGFDKQKKIWLFDTSYYMNCGGYKDTLHEKTAQRFDKHDNTLKQLIIDSIPELPCWIEKDQYLYTYYEFSNKLKSMSFQSNPLLNPVSPVYDCNSKASNKVYGSEYSYNGSGDLVREVFSNNININLNKIISYAHDEHHNVTTMQILLYDAGGTPHWQNYQHIDYTYINDLVETEVIMSWRDSFWLNFQRNIYTYDNQKNITAHVNQKWNVFNNTWDNSFYDSFFYCGLNNTIRIGRIWDTTTKDWVSYDKDSSGYDSSNNRVYFVKQVFVDGSFVNDSEIIATYNKFDQPLYIEYHQWNKTLQQWQPRQMAPYWSRYHYQTYDAARERPDFSLSSIIVKLYPSPARGFIRLETQWDVPEEAHFMICDATGRTIVRWSEKEMEDYSRIIPVSGWANGCYFLKIQGAKSSYAGKFIVNN